jgi:hypothetical protein
MQGEINRMELLKSAVVGGTAYVVGPNISTFGEWPRKSKLISPGCRRSKVKVAKIYMGIPQSHYPNPDLDLKKEVKFYQSEFAKLKDELAVNIDIIAH